MLPPPIYTPRLIIPCSLLPSIPPGSLFHAPSSPLHSQAHYSVLHPSLCTPRLTEICLEPWGHFVWKNLKHDHIQYLAVSLVPEALFDSARSWLVITRHHLKPYQLAFLQYYRWRDLLVTYLKQQEIVLLFQPISTCSTRLLVISSDEIHIWPYLSLSEVIDGIDIATDFILYLTAVPVQLCDSLDLQSVLCTDTQTQNTLPSLLTAEQFVEIDKVLWPVEFWSEHQIAALSVCTD